jgi:hypothetical protein
LEKNKSFKEAKKLDERFLDSVSKWSCKLRAVSFAL